MKDEFAKKKKGASRKQKNNYVVIRDDQLPTNKE